MPAAVRDEIRIAEEQSIIEIDLMQTKQKKKISPPQKNQPNFNPSMQPFWLDTTASVTSSSSISSRLSSPISSLSSSTPTSTSTKSKSLEELLELIFKESDQMEEEDGDSSDKENQEGFTNAVRGCG